MYYYAFECFLNIQKFIAIFIDNKNSELFSKAIHKINTINMRK